MSFTASGEPDQMIISLGTRQASVIDDELTASFTLGRTILESIQTKSSPDALRPVRAVVEIVRHGAGLMPRALLGGAFTPSEDGADPLPRCRPRERTAPESLHARAACGPR
jgi:hypothetical protein